MSTTPGRPSVDDVALLIRARTKDSSGNEVGTFDGETRPTDVEVEKHIDACMTLIEMRVGSTTGLNADLLPAFANVVAYRAALRIEKGYYPEQVRSDRSAYDQLYQEYADELAALEAAAAAGPAGVVSEDIGVLAIGSWTSIPNSWIER